MNIRSKSWPKLKYYDPADILRKLRAVEMKNPVSELPYKVGSLRTKSLRTRGESRQCALFCHGMSQCLGLTLSYAESEDSDYDFVVFCAENSSFVPVQMKELVPEKLNPDTDLQKEIDKLSKYVDSSDLCVALYLNRELKSLDIRRLDVSRVNVAELWLFGAASEDQKQWKLIGNLLEQPLVYEFHYPQA